MNYRDMMKVIRLHQEQSTVCIIKGTDEKSIEDARVAMLKGRYWIRNSETGTIMPNMPCELLEAESSFNAPPFSNILVSDYLIVAPDFDQESYWKTVPANPPLFSKNTKRVKADISCAKILEMDAAQGSVVEDFKAMAAANNLTPGELIGYLFEKL